MQDVWFIALTAILAAAIAGLAAACAWLEERT